MTCAAGTLHSFIPLRCQVGPFFVLDLDQRNLLCSKPAFHLLLAYDGIIGVTKCLIIYKLSEIVSAAKPTAKLHFVFIHPSHEIACYSNVQNTVLLVRDNVDIPYEGPFSSGPPLSPLLTNFDQNPIGGLRMKKCHKIAIGADARTVINQLKSRTFKPDEFPLNIVDNE
jgi:hypothetical protein